MAEIWCNLTNISLHSHVLENRGRHIGVLE